MDPQRDEEDSNGTDNCEHDDDTRVFGGEVASLNEIASDERNCRHLEIAEMRQSLRRVMAEDQRK